MEDGVCSVVRSCDKHSSTVSIGGFVRRALRISDGPELSVITGCSGSSEMAAFSRVRRCRADRFRDHRWLLCRGFAGADDAGRGCRLCDGPCRDSCEEGFVIAFVLAIDLSTSPSIGVVIKEYWRGCFSCCSRCSLRRGACFSCCCCFASLVSRHAFLASASTGRISHPQPERFSVSGDAAR
jgi:hypothetical protein